MLPGIGYYSALFIWSEIGDTNRFPDSYQLCYNAGLVPSTLSSGGVTHHGAINKAEISQDNIRDQAANYNS